MEWGRNIITVILFVWGIDWAIGDQASPATGYTLDPKETFNSPKGSVLIEQFCKITPDEFSNWKIQVTTNGKSSFLPALADHDGEPSVYSPGFRMTPNEKWLVRMQKTGAGYEAVYLYHRVGDKFIETTKKPLSDLAWDYFNKVKPSSVPMPENHIFATIIKGTDENYKWLGVKWEDSRYIVLTLSGGWFSPQKGYLAGWRCRYDVQTGQFDVPPVLQVDNSHAVNRPNAW